jgi:hypothetical protein
MAAMPPLDDDDWSDEQWLAWLRETAGQEPPPPPRQVARRGPGRSIGMTILAGGLIGVQEALYGPRDEEPTLVVQAGEPGPDEMEVHLDPDDVPASWVRLPEEPTVPPWGDEEA